MVEAQGGAVGVRSVPGTGSTFFARLPRRQELAPSPIINAVRRTGQDFDSRSHSILVIEDNLRDRSWMVATLERAGYTVESVPTGANAIRLLQSRRFDAITLDLLLPDMSGWEVLGQIRENSVNCDVPVVIVTVLDDQAIRVGFSINGFLEKPIDREVLLNTLRRAGFAPGGKPAVLLVDDDPMDLELYQTLLDECGFTTSAYSNPREALSAAARKLPDVIVVDLIMADIDGFEFIRRFREIDRNRTTPVIVLTGKNLTRQESESLKAVARTVLSKGSGSVDALLAEIEAALSTRDASTTVDAVLDAPGAAQSNREARPSARTFARRNGY